MTITLSMLVLAVIGLLIYAFANGKPAEIGRLVFFAALLALCIEWPHVAAVARIGR